MQQITLTTLDVTTWCVILRLWKVLPLRMLLLEGQDGQTSKDHVHNCAPYHLSNVDGQIDPSLVMVPTSLWCMLCGQVLGTTTMLICDKCFEVGIWDASCHQWKTNGRSANWWNDFVINAPYRLRFLGLHNKTNLRFSSMVIHIWLGMQMIIVKWLMMGFTFAFGLMVLLLGTKMFIHGGFPIGSFIMFFSLGGP
jgi:hypothetical protein